MTTYDQDGTAFFLQAHDRHFGESSPADDRMHREANALVDHPELVETQYFGFSVPEARIHGFNYVWAHPNLGVVSGGPWAWRGVKATQMHSEIFDMRNYLPISLVGEFDKYTLPNNYSVEVTKRLEEVRTTYEDAARGNAFDVTYTAFMPPAMLATGKHFDQGMRTRGSVTLAGTTYPIEGFTIRDRSWGEIRPETPRAAPVIHWLTPVFGEDFALHVYAVEDPTKRPLWEGLYDFTPAQAAAFCRGWVWRDGELTHVRSISLTCEWDTRWRYPKAYRVELVDEAGRPWSMTGELVAGSNWFIWNNMFTPVLLIRWECDGKVGYGDAQVGAWTDFVRERLP